MRTPLYSKHKELGARFVEFAGWEMPLEYKSIVEEVRAVRSSCGLFDVSHMGRLIISDGFETLQKLTSRDIAKLKEGKVQYNLLLNEQGGVKDDITLYRLSEREFFMCVNAGNKEKVKEWLLGWGLSVRDMSQEWIQFAIQGPRSQEVLSKHLPVGDIKYYHFKVFGDMLLSRTGYTGEDGFEVYAPVEKGLELFMELSKECMPCGLGARDVLRIEAGMPLYGHELSEDITPFEANLDRYVSLEKDFLGKDALLQRKVEKKLFGLELLQRGVPREGYKVFYKDMEIGYVSSGTYSPTLQKGIALCFVRVDHRIDGLEVDLQVRDRRLPARLRSYPFLAPQGG